MFHGLNDFGKNVEEKFTAIDEKYGQIIRDLTKKVQDSEILIRSLSDENQKFKSDCMMRLSENELSILHLREKIQDGEKNNNDCMNENILHIQERVAQTERDSNELREKLKFINGFVFDSIGIGKEKGKNGDNLGDFLPQLDEIDEEILLDVGSSPFLKEIEPVSLKKQTGDESLVPKKQTEPPRKNRNDDLTTSTSKTTTTVCSYQIAESSDDENDEDDFLLNLKPQEKVLKCKVVQPITHTSTSATPPDKKKKKKKKKKRNRCSSCGDVGHNINGCPKRRKKMGIDE